MLYLLVCVSVTIAIALYYTIQAVKTYVVRLNTIRQYGCQPPPSLPQRDPIFGLDIVIQIFRHIEQRSRSLSMKEQFDKYGRTYQTKLYGRARLFSIDSPNLQAIFSTNFKDWGLEPLRLFVFEPFVGPGIMTTDGPRWEHARAMVKPIFARAQIADLSAYEVHLQRFMNLIPKDGSTVDLQPLFAKLALDSSTEFLFGESVHSLSPDSTLDARSFLESYNYGMRGVGKRMQLPKWNFLTRDPKFWRSCQTARSFVGAYVDRALQADIVQSRTEKKTTDGRYVLLNELVKVNKDRADILNQLLNIFMPAHDAAAIALTNIFFNLARHQEVWNRLRAEILGIGSAELTFERLKSLKYLQYVINETFRRYPAIGTTSRAAVRDTVLPTGGGPSGTSPIFLRKGDALTTSFYALHQRKDIYGEDADLFRPERWETLRPPPWTYMPFGGGLRVCPGQQLALTEIAYTIVRIVQTFPRIENRDPVLEFVEQYRIGTESKNGAKVSFSTS
ncbi:hypothetical protein MMC25_004987 [Agyrium rufum]|nr:hypothetical protein [Agyrium rufum]